MQDNDYSLLSFEACLTEVGTHLSNGHLQQADRAISWAARHYVTSAEQRELTLYALRCKLLGGMFSEWADSQSLWQRSSRRWPEDPAFHGLQNALYHAAGWRVAPDPPQNTSLVALLSALIYSGRETPEVPYSGLAALGQHIVRTPTSLEKIARETVSTPLLLALGERVLPPTIEATVAEAWFTQNQVGDYPRSAVISKVSAEPAYGVVSLYLNVLQSLRSGNIGQAVSASDTLLTKDGYWLWLRLLFLITYFGNPDQIAALPRRLRSALQTVALDGDHVAPPKAYLAFAQQTRYEAKVRSKLEEDLRAGEDTGQNSARISEKFLMGSDVQTLPWTAPPGSCLLVQHWLETQVARPLPTRVKARLTAPHLSGTHRFLRGLRADDAVPGRNRRILAAWYRLPKLLRLMEPYLGGALQAMVRLTPPAKAAAEAIEFHRSGVGSTEICRAFADAKTDVSCEAFIRFYLALPQRETVSALPALPSGVFAAWWMPLMEATLKLAQPGAEADQIAPSALLKRLVSRAELPSLTENYDGEALERLAPLVSTLPLDATGRDTRLRIALRSGYAGKDDVCLCVLGTLNGTAAKDAAEVMARLWLRTGREAYKAANMWQECPDSWGHLARCWHSLLHLSPPPTVPIPNRQGNNAFTELVALYDVTRRWLAQSAKESKLLPFTEWDGLVKQSRSWGFLCPCTDEAGNRQTLEELPALAVLLHVATRAVSSVRTLPVAWSKGTIAPELVAVALACICANDSAHYAFLLQERWTPMTPSFRRQLRQSLLALGLLESAVVLDMDEIASLSSAGKALAAMNTASAREKAARLALQKVPKEDLHSELVWRKMGDFLLSTEFRPWSIPQWGMVSDWREKLTLVSGDGFAAALGHLDDDMQVILKSVFASPFPRPVLIDGSNLTREAGINQYFADSFEFIELLWRTLAELGCYPIITYVDSNEHSVMQPDAQEHLNHLIREGMIMSTAGLHGEDKTADYRILRDAYGRYQHLSPLIVTNDFYAKPASRKGWKGHPDFPNLSVVNFERQRVQVTNGVLAQTWDLRLPTGELCRVSSEMTPSNMTQTITWPPSPLLLSAKPKSAPALPVRPTGTGSSAAIKKASARNDQPDIDPPSPPGRPPTQREISTWIYGDYNSQ